MRREILVAAIVLLMAGACKSRLQQNIEQAESDLTLAQSNADFLQSSCHEDDVALAKAQGAESNAQWDIATGANVDHISNDQEWDIRWELANENGINPAQANGWKDVLRGRAENARKELPEIERQIKEAQAKRDKSCKSLIQNYQL